MDPSKGILHFGEQEEVRWSEVRAVGRVPDDLERLGGVVLLLEDPAGGLLDEAQVVMEDVEDGPSGDLEDRGQMSHINTSVLLNEPPDIVDHLLSPDKLVDGLALLSSMFSPFLTFLTMS